jgi:hypothetical protein
MTPADPARIHLIPAKDAPVVVVIRRKPSKCVHLIRWNTETNALEQGSWFEGRLYPNRCDVSFDGHWMVYLAMGASGETWNGICRLPFLRTFVEGPNMGSWFGGGYWQDRRTLLLNQWKPSKGSVPFQLGELQPEFGGEDLGVLYPRWIRDGWRRRGENYGTDRRIQDSKKYRVACDGDDGWEIQPSRRHPLLTVRYIGYLDHGYTFRYALEGYPDLIDDQVDSACWDAHGNLVFSRNGIVSLYSLQNLQQGTPGVVHDLEPLTKESHQD